MAPRPYFIGETERGTCVSSADRVGASSLGHLN